MDSPCLGTKFGAAGIALRRRVHGRVACQGISRRRRSTDRPSEREKRITFPYRTERESPSSGQRQNFRRGLKVCGLVVPTRLWLSSPSPSSARTRAGRARPPGNGSSFGATTLTSERCWKSSINPAPPFGCWGPICAPHTPLTKEI